MQIRADEISTIIRKRIEEFDKEVQIAPPSTVFKIVPLLPATYPILASGKQTDDSKSVVPLDKVVQFVPPSIVFLINP